MTLTEFLLARIAEGEASARYAAGIYDDDSDMWFVPPSRVLAECAAKRQIVRECTEGLRSDLDCHVGHEVAFENILGFLALPYADHSDYLPEWKP